METNGHIFSMHVDFLIWSASITIPLCVKAAPLHAEVKDLISTVHTQHIFMHPLWIRVTPALHHLTSSHSHLRPRAALLKCWKGHRNMPPLRISSLSDARFEFHMHSGSSFVAFLWVIRNTKLRDSVCPAPFITTFTFHSRALYFLRGLIHC